MRRLLMTIALATLGAVPAAASAQDASIPGFTPEHSAEQAQAEQRFQGAISANSIGRFSRTVSRRPQLIGSPGNRDAFNFSLATLGRYGLDPDSASYDVYISRPNSIQVTMTAPYPAGGLQQGAALPLAALLRRGRGRLQRLLAER